MEDDGTHHIGMWKMHCIHPKIACLFLRGVSTREALEIVYRLAPAIPSTLLPLYDMFANWVRMAVTSSDGRHSLLNVPSEVWSHTDEKAEDWYDTVVARHAPLGETVNDMPATTAHGAAAPIGARAGSSTGYAGVSQGAENVTTILAAIRDGLSRRPQEENKGGKVYKAFEKQILFQTVGLDGPNFEAYQDTQLPPFFVAFQQFRGKAQDARAFLEHYFSEKWPKDRSQKHFLFTSSLVADFRQLLFAGRDPQIGWANRFNGISIFSIIPYAHDHAELRSQMEHFEDDTITHTQKDKAANEALSAKAGIAKIPATRDAFRDHLAFFETFLRMYFSPANPLKQGLETLITELLTASTTSNWTRHTWHALFWNIHVGVRCFFQGDKCERFNRVVGQFQMGNDPSRANLPFELSSESLPPVVSPDTSIASTISSLSKSTPETPPDRDVKQPGRGKNKRQPEGPPSVVEFALPFQDDFSRVSKACGRSVTVAALAPDQRERDALLGDFSALGKDKKSICLNHFLIGRCNRKQWCRYAHELTKDPNQGQMNGLKKRITDKCDALIKEHAKKE